MFYCFYMSLINWHGCYRLLNLKYIFSHVFRLEVWHTCVYSLILGPGLGAWGARWPPATPGPQINLRWASVCGPAVTPECVARVISGCGFGARDTAGFSSYRVIQSTWSWAVGLYGVVLWGSSWLPKLFTDFWPGPQFCVKYAILPVLELLRWGWGHRENSPVTQTTSEPTLLSWEGGPRDPPPPPQLPLTPPSPLTTLPNPVFLRLSGHTDPIVFIPLMLPFDTQVCHERQICLRLHRMLKVILERPFQHITHGFESSIEFLRPLLAKLHENAAMSHGAYGFGKLCSNTWKRGQDKHVGMFCLFGRKIASPPPWEFPRLQGGMLSFIQPLAMCMLSSHW